MQIAAEATRTWTAIRWPAFRHIVLRPQLIAVRPKTRINRHWVTAALAALITIAISLSISYDLRERERDRDGRAKPRA